MRLARLLARRRRGTLVELVGPSGDTRATVLAWCASHGYEAFDGSRTLRLRRPLRPVAGADGTVREPVEPSGPYWWRRGADQPRQPLQVVVP